MVKNIPNKYTMELLKERINKNFMERYDFFYLPMDFQVNICIKYKCNMGYAFINLKTKQDIFNFYNNFNGKKWDLFKSKKVVI